MIETPMKRIIITGASGMIGSSLTELALSRGIEVTALVRSGRSPGRKNAFESHPLLTVVEYDLAELSACPALPSCDAFFHLAWDKTTGAGRDDAVAQSKNILYTLDAVRLAEKTGCRVFVGAGSQAEYGTAQAPLNSTTSIDPKSGYGIAKYAAGRVSALLCRQLNIRHCWARILSVYGERDRGGSLISTCVDAMLKGGSPELTPGEQIWDYLYAGDAVRAMLDIAEKGRDQAVYCVGSGLSRPLREYVLDIRDAIDPGLEVHFGQKPYPENQPMYLCADISELTRDTGFVPQVSFEDGIRRIIRSRTPTPNP